MELRKKNYDRFFLCRKKFSIFDILFYCLYCLIPYLLYPFIFLPLTAFFAVFFYYIPLALQNNATRLFDKCSRSAS